MEQTQPPPAPAPAPAPPADQQRQQNPPPPSSSSSVAAAASPPVSLPPATTSLPSTTATTSSSSSVSLPSNPNLNTNSNPTPKPTTISSSQPQISTPNSQNVQNRPAFSRPWQQPSPFQHFSLPPPPPPPPPHSSSSSAPSSMLTPVSQNPRGGMAIGVPAQPTSFSSLNPPSFGQQFGGLGRNVPDSMPSSSGSQVRQPIQGMQGMGMMGSINSGSSMRPAGVPPQQLRPVPSSLRPLTSSSSQSPVTQNFQGHGMLRVPAVGSPASQSPSGSQNLQSQNQPWLSSGAQGKPPLPTPSLRPQMSPQSLQQRPHIPSLHHHSITNSLQQQHSSAQQSQPSTSSQSQGHSMQQVPQSRIQQSSPNQPLARGQGLGIQRPSSHPIMRSITTQPGPPNRATTSETEEPCTRILSKRSIQEIVTQIDPSEKLDSEIEDILIDIAEEFLESVTTFGCSLAKHRKSDTLEAKDILLHLERNWNMTLPGFGGDDVRIYKKPSASDIHRERSAAVKKSMLSPDMTNSKGSAQTGGK